MNYSELYDNVISEADFWCSLHNEDIDDISSEGLDQCITDVAYSLNISEEDVENILLSDI